LPPEVADETEVVLTAAAERFADDRSRYMAVAQAATQATSAAISNAVGQVRDVANSTKRDNDDDDDEVELKLSTCCVIRCVSSSRHR